MQEWIQSLIVKLAGRRPLHEVVPDLEALRDSPEEVLGRQAVRIGSLSNLRLAAVIAGVWLLFYFLYEFANLGSWYFWGISIVSAFCVAKQMFAAVNPCRHEIILRRDGVELKYGERSVWCPWALFDVQGLGFLQYGDTLDPRLYLPVAADAVPYVEYREDGRCIAQGMIVKTPQFSFRSVREVKLGRFYEVTPGELMTLLLELGRRLGEPLPQGSEPYEVQTRKALATLGRSGWITLPLAHLVFPERCCDCGGDFDEYFEWRFTELHLSVPFCNRCRQRLTGAARRWAIAGVVGFPLLGCVALPWMILENMAVFLLFMAILGFAIGQRIGFAAFERWGGPLQLSYSNIPGRTHVSLRFRNPQYAKDFQALLDGDKPSDGG